MEFHSGNDFTQRVGERGGRLQFLELRFRLCDLPDREQHRSAIDSFRIRLRLPVLRILRECLEQIAAAIGGEGLGKRLLNVRAEPQVIRVHDAGIVEAPLDDVDRVNDRGFARRFARFHDAQLAGFQFQLPALVA